MELDIQYQLHAYLHTLLPTMVLIVGAETGASPVENVRLTQSGGDPSPDLDRQDVLVQFISSYTSQTKSYAEISRIYGALRRQLRIIFPQVTVDSVVYTAITAWQIVALQLPGYIGADEKGRHQYSVNFKVTIGS